MRLHPLTVPYRALSRGASVGISLFFIAVLGSGSDRLEGIGIAAFLLAGLLVGVAWEAAYYRRFEYELTADSLDIESGVISRRRREIPLRRVQNVDIRRNLLQRGLGIAAVSLETAGGGETEATLRFVGHAEARRLQRELRRRAAGETEPAEEETADLLFALSARELTLLSALSFDPRGPPLLVLSLPFVPLPDAETLLGTPSLLLGWLLAGVVAAWAMSAAATFARYFGFRLSRVGDELRYERGLLRRYDGSIPIGKVQTLTIRENALQRPLGYAGLAVETAGYAAGQSPAGGSEAAVPFARRDRVLALARSIESFDAPTFDRPPERARRRYAIRYALAGLVAVGLVAGVGAAIGAGPGVGPYLVAGVAALALAPVAAGRAWQNRGYHHGDGHVVTRNGFWRRTTRIVPHYRIQTVIVRRTPFQRRWDLATVIVDTAGSLGIAGDDARAIDRDAAEAAALRDRLVDRLLADLERRRKERRDRHPSAAAGDPEEKEGLGE